MVIVKECNFGIVQTKLKRLSFQFLLQVWCEKNVEKHFVDIFIYESFIVKICFKRIFVINIEFLQFRVFAEKIR